MSIPANRLILARKKAGLTMQEAANQSHNTQSTVRFMEAGYTVVTAPKAVVFGNIYGVSPAWILWGGDYPETADLRYNPFKTGNRISNSRRDTGLRQHELAELVHMTVPALSGIEDGSVKLTPHMCEKISNVLGVDKAWLLFGVERPA